MRQRLVADIEAGFLHETEKAFKITLTGEQKDAKWLPKSAVDGVYEVGEDNNANILHLEPGNVYVFVMSQYNAEKYELV